MPLVRFPTPTGLVYTIDLTKIVDRANPRTVEAPITGGFQETAYIDWGDGSAPQAVSSGASHPHTYADGAGDVFTVVIRSATGHLPRCKFDSNTAPATNIAITSIDHCYGSFSAATYSFASGLSHTVNLRYVDPRIISDPLITNIDSVLFNSGIIQDVQSFCFDFMTYCQYFSASFQQCAGLYGAISATAFDNCISVKSFKMAFRAASGLTAPYVFWKTDGTLNTDKFPALTEGTWCYYGCSGMDLSQIPSTYGGTMTV